VKIRSHKQESLAIVYDADRIQQPGPALFDPEHWKRQGGLAGHAIGRGSALLLDTEFGPAVLRQYLRGGWPARLSHDRYFFTGYDRSRPLAEFRMLAALSGLGLPAPTPLAALCERSGLLYRGWLLMQRILQVQPLADLLGSCSGDTAFWQRVGAVIRTFHDAGVVHADLNARNILVAEDESLYLVDFDRARLSVGDANAFRGNLERLKRSLVKLWPASAADGLAACWGELLTGYGQAGKTP